MTRKPGGTGLRRWRTKRRINIVKKVASFVPGGTQWPSYISLKGKGPVLPMERPEIEAARKGADPNRPPNRLIDGEDPSALSPHVVRRWLRTYAELENLEMELLDLLAFRAAQMSEDARHEAGETNFPVLVSQLDRFHKRRDFWQQRKREMETPARH
jgi:hypothetical protein